MNEFLVLLENAAGAAWFWLAGLGVAAVAMLIFDRPRLKIAARRHRPVQERKVA